MPGGVAPRALLGILALIVAIAVATVPLVEARPKDKDGGKRGEVTTEEVSPGNGGQGEAAPAAVAPDVEQPLTASEGNAGSNERALLSSDADGDYIPDALDNCPGVQNPDQADADGDGNGDACPVYQDLDGDTVPDKSDNCPNIATSDFSDNDGDGVGNPCDKSPDGIEPEPEPVPDLNGRGGEGKTEPPAPENGENQDGQSVERDGRERSKQRERTDIERATITTGADGEQPGDQPAQDEQPPVAEPVRDNPRRNEELIAEAAAAGEIFDPAPPPEPQKAWDESEENPVEWDSLIRIDAGATTSAERTDASDEEPNDTRSRDAERGNNGNAGDGDVAESEFARGWVRAKLVLQQETQDEPGDGDANPDPDNRDYGAARAPVPVESGLVITGVEELETPANSDEPGDGDAETPSDREAQNQTNVRDNGNAGRDRNERNAGQDGSRRDGSSRGRAAPVRRDGRAAGQDAEPGDTGRDRRDRERAQGWSDDRYFEGGAALNWSADVDVEGTDEDALYLTQRSGSGPGRKRGFSYAIPVEENGTYLVRLFFAEPYWGAPGGPDGEEGERVFSVTAEGETILDDLDVYAEVGSLTALVKQVEVQIEDGELNLRFSASAGEPIVAAIEILQPAG